jgi:nicotinamidase-related amidase
LTLTTLDPNTALIVVDLQNGITALPVAHSMDTVTKNAAALADAFRSRDLPVVLVTVDGGASGRTEQPRRQASDRPAGWADPIAELRMQPGDHRVVKKTWGAFTSTGLAEHLAGLGVTQVVVLGVATSVGVESTARQAHEHGLNVTLAVDAMTDMVAEAHANSVTRIFPRLGETGTTADILALLAASRA